MCKEEKYTSVDLRVTDVLFSSVIEAYVTNDMKLIKCVDKCWYSDCDMFHSNINSNYIGSG